MRRSAVTSSPLDATFRSPPPPGSVARRPLSDMYVFSFPLARLIARLSPWHFRQSEFHSFWECREAQCERNGRVRDTYLMWSVSLNAGLEQLNCVRDSVVSIPNRRWLWMTYEPRPASRPNEVRRYVTRLDKLAGIGVKFAANANRPKRDAGHSRQQYGVSWNVPVPSSLIQVDRPKWSIRVRRLGGSGRPVDVEWPVSWSRAESMTRVRVVRHVSVAAGYAVLRRCKSWLDWCATMILISATTRKRRIIMIVLAVSLLLLRAHRAAGSERLGESCFFLFSFICPEFRESRNDQLLL